ncbi:MAG: hypothetical protein J6I45_04530 [Clostridia bacterium]|nr:hypothetical protein [Clostridia bacterium]
MIIPDGSIRIRLWQRGAAACFDYLEGSQVQLEITSSKGPDVEEIFYTADAYDAARKANVILRPPAGMCSVGGFALS